MKSPKKALFIQQIFLDQRGWFPILSVGETGIIYIFTQINSVWRLIRAKQQEKSAFHKVIQCHKWGDCRTGSGVLRLSAFMRKAWDTVKPSSKLILFIFLYLHFLITTLRKESFVPLRYLPLESYNFQQQQSLSLWSLALKSRNIYSA